MFDASAIELIQRAPQFGELDLNNLSKEFTKGYTEIVSARMALRENIENLQSIGLLKDQVIQIASTYEAYVFLLKTNENHKSAAFIAASAHQLSFQIDGVLRTEYSMDKLSNQFIDSQISAALLFFIAGYTAESSEMMGKLNIEDCTDTIKGLLKSLRALLTGQLRDFSNIQPAYPSFEDWGEMAATNALWTHLHHGIIKLLTSISTSKSESARLRNEANSFFEEVQNLSQFKSEIILEESDSALTYNGMFNGPYYLAGLLIIANDTIKDIALINSTFPTGVDSEAWSEMLTHISMDRPYLWPNHIEAINQGYLNHGISSVVSFPTGGGKSTLAELKIATYLIRNEPIIFVVPTLALVDQVSKSLKAAFPATTTQMSVDTLDLDDLESDFLPDISVMTPESLLVRMSFNPDTFQNLGLFIFDECHLIHSKSSDAVDRRSIDAMLCLLRIIELCENVDMLLMSAMIENNRELSDWIRGLIQKEVLSLNIKWKPTRQAKGCVVYDSSTIRALNEYIRIAPKTPKGKLTASSKRNLQAIPYSFFSLNQSWHSNSARDYKFTKLANENISLGINDANHLTSNRNLVAASIAKNAISAGIKTIIFASDIKACNSIVDDVGLTAEPMVQLNENELKLISLIELEFGSVAHSFYSPCSISLPHHGILIKEERQLHESLFSRPSSLNLIVATSTLAQGINLPAECVIIAGNTRFDPVTNRQQELDAHELLNAAGRAGRAGKNATGVVLVIPGRVVSFAPEDNRITEYWNEIKSVFTNEDQCLTIEDPLQLVLDRLHLSHDALTSDIKYLIQKLPAGADGNCSNFIRSTFGAFQARSRNDENWINERIEDANRAFNRIRADDIEYELSWHDRLSSAAGIEPNLIRELESSFTQNLNNLDHSIDYVVWFMSWLSQSYEKLSKFIRIETLESAFGSEFSNLSENDRALYFETKVVELIKLWMYGSSLRLIELAIGTEERLLNKCDKARKFVIRVVPEIAYAVGVLGHVYRYMMIEINLSPENSKIEYLSQLTRFGFDRPSKLALHRLIESPTSRAHTHNIFSGIENNLNAIDETLSFQNLMSLVGVAYRQR